MAIVHQVSLLLYCKEESFCSLIQLLDKRTNSSTELQSYKSFYQTFCIEQIIINYSKFTAPVSWKSVFTAHHFKDMERQSYHAEMILHFALSSCNGLT